MSFTTTRELNITRIISKRERRCIPWVFKDYNDEKVLKNIRRSHSEKNWNVICDLYNEMISSSRHRSVNAVCSKWKALKLRPYNTSMSTSLISKESFAQAHRSSKLIQQVTSVSLFCFFTKSSLLIHTFKETLTNYEIQYENDFNNFEPSVTGWDCDIDAEEYDMQVTELMKMQREMTRMVTEAACEFRCQ